jgi:hypothetical protein
MVHVPLSSPNQSLYLKPYSLPWEGITTSEFISLYWLYVLGDIPIPLVNYLKNASECTILNVSEKKIRGWGEYPLTILSCSRFKFQFSLFNTILLNTLMTISFYWWRKLAWKQYNVSERSDMSGHDLMLVGFTTAYAISVYHY